MLCRGRTRPGDGSNHGGRAAPTFQPLGPGAWSTWVSTTDLHVSIAPAISSPVSALILELSPWDGGGGTLVMCLLHTVLVPRFRRWVRAQGKYKGSCIWVASFCLPNEALHHAYRKTFLFQEFWQCRHWLPGGQCYAHRTLDLQENILFCFRATGRDQSPNQEALHAAQWCPGWQASEVLSNLLGGHALSSTRRFWSQQQG